MALPDIEVWKRVPALPTSKIAIGTFDVNRIDTLANLKGTVTAAKVASLPTTKITSGSFNADRIPQLPTARITSGSFNANRIPILPTTKITTGTFGLERIPSITDAYLAGGITSDKISALSGTAVAYPLNADTVGTTAIKASGVGNAELAGSGLDISKFTVGVAGVARIPSLPTSKITTGTFTADRIPILGRGAYSAIVYKDGALYVAEDNVGTLISQNANASIVIQAALDYKVGRILCMDAIYVIITAISVPSYRTLEGESHNTIFEQPATPLDYMIKNSDYSGGNTDIKIKTLTIDGKSRGVDWKHGIWLQNVTRFEIADIYGKNFTGDGGGEADNLIVVGHPEVTGRTVSYGSIHGIIADNIEGDVVYVTGKDSTTEYSQYVNVYDILTEDATWITVDFNEVEFSNIDNVISFNSGEACVNLDGSHYCNVNNVTAYMPNACLIFGNHTTGTTGTCNNNTASNINCYHPTAYGIWLLNSYKNIISNFNIYGGVETIALLKIQAIGAGTTDEGVASHNQFVNGLIINPQIEFGGVLINEATAADDASYSTFNNVHIIKITGTARDGFFIQGDHCTFTACTSKGAGILNGFYFSGSSHSTLLGCTAIDNAGWGVKGVGADYLLLTGNRLTGNTSGSTTGLGGNSKAPADSNFL